MAAAPGCIQTYRGKYIDPFNAQASDIFIEDIAHALSNLCRFTGHVKRFYSVAEHSLHVSSLVPQEHKLTALLHDAAEAYLSDLSRPIKHRPEMAFYREAEDQLLAIILLKYGCPVVLPACVKKADDAMLHLEALTLMAAGADWADKHIAAEVSLEYMTPSYAKHRFTEEAMALLLAKVEAI